MAIVCSAFASAALVTTSGAASAQRLVAKWGTFGMGPGQFDGPFGVAVDGAGQIFVVDRNNHRIQKFDNTGKHLLTWGTKGGGDGQFDWPFGVAVDGAGQVFVADRNNHRIQKFDNTGKHLLTWGTRGSGNGQFAFPFGVAVDGAGQVFVTDTINQRIQKFDNMGKHLLTWGTRGSGDGQFDEPSGVAVDGAGQVFVVDSRNHRIQKFDNTGKHLLTWGTRGSGNGQFAFPFGVAVDGAGHVFVADLPNHRIQKFDNTGKHLMTWGTRGSGNGQFIFPSDVAVDGAGQVFVADVGNDRIQKFDCRVGRSAQRFVAKWGTRGSGDGQFNQPFGVAVDGAGQVFVADTFNDRIQKFDNTGKHLLTWGTSGSGNGQFNRPRGVAVDGAGQVFVVDSRNHRIQKFDNKGKHLLTWGTRGQFSSPIGVAVDGAGQVFVADMGNGRILKFDNMGKHLLTWGRGGSGNGQFDAPVGVAVDGDGEVFVVDSRNHRIQKFDSTGKFLLTWGTFGSGNGQFTFPGGGVAVDGAGQVFVADTQNRRIQKFDNTGNHLLTWGTFGSGNGQFNWPQGVAVDGAGQVFVADGNDRIQKFFDFGVRRIAPRETGRFFASVLAPVGDFDGDGYQDIAIGHPGANNGAGSMRVISGKTHCELFSHTPCCPLAYGTSIVGGDFTGNGRSDVVVGAPGPGDSGILMASKCKPICHGWAKKFAAAENVVAGQVVAAGHFNAEAGIDGLYTKGKRVASVIADQIVAWTFAGGKYTELWSSTLYPNLAIESIAVLGDVNRDGFDDFAIGFPTYSMGLTNRGRVEVRSGRDGARIWWIQGGSQNERFGHVVAKIGDVTGDGIPDVAVGSPFAGSGAGNVIYYNGATGGWLGTVWGKPGERFGYAVASAGDVDHDGIPDVLASSVPASASAKGFVTVLSGKTQASIGTSYTGTTAAFGTAVAGLETSGDDTPDVVIGEPSASGGEAWVYDREPIPQPPTWQRYGNTCAGTGGKLPRIHGSNRSGAPDFLRGALGRARVPVPETFWITLTSGRANSAAVLMIGPRQRPSQPLFGGCFLSTVPVITLGVGTTANGTAEVGVPQLLPVGSRIAFQWFVVDPGANAANLTTSDAAEMSMGRRLF